MSIRIISKASRSRWLKYMIGIMGIITIPLLIYNLFVCNATDKIFAFNDLTMALLLLGTYAALVSRGIGGKK